METQDCNSSDIRLEAEVGSANASNNFSPNLIEDFNDIPSNQDDFDQSTIDPSARPSKKIRSKVWDHLIKIRAENFKDQKAQCKYCNAILGADLAKGTSCLKNHIDRCKKYPANIELAQRKLALQARFSVDGKLCHIKFEAFAANPSNCYCLKIDTTGFIMDLDDLLSESSAAAPDIWDDGFYEIEYYVVQLVLVVFYFLDWVKHLLSDTKLFETFLRITVTSAATLGVIGLGVGSASGYISPWTGCFYSLLDPTYAKDHIPIIASVSEHQPTTWSSFMFDFHILLFLFPAGLYFCFKRLSDATIFVVMYGLTSMYFAGVMVRLILVATPAICLISAIAVSATIKNLTSLLKSKNKAMQTSATKGSTGSKASSKAMQDQSLPFQKNAAVALLAGAFYLLSRYVTHCTWVTSEVYSSPSIVLAARGAYGNRVIFDDYREAYFWLRQNTPPDAKVMSWWDYGYQITAMGNRTVIVDNSTWNNTHIATVGRAMASYEGEAYEIMQSLDVDNVLVVFGGVTGYSFDDINKYSITFQMTTKSICG
ncbi:Dolichyl-diphosphooligosaccharide--protein glycosyltransferase subunit stt3b [Ancistrocladus abbreviatus]